MVFYKKEREKIELVARPDLIVNITHFLVESHIHTSFPFPGLQATLSMDNRNHEPAQRAPRGTRSETKPQI